MGIEGREFAKKRRLEAAAAAQAEADRNEPPETPKQILRDTRKQDEDRYKQRRAGQYSQQKLGQQLAKEAGVAGMSNDELNGISPEKKIEQQKEDSGFFSDTGEFVGGLAASGGRILVGGTLDAVDSMTDGLVFLADKAENVAAGQLGFDPDTLIDESLLLSMKKFDLSVEVEREIQEKMGIDTGLGGNPEDVGENFLRGAVQFILPFGAAGKILKGIKFAQGAGAARLFARGTVAGAAADFMAFDPREGRLTDLMNDWSMKNFDMAIPYISNLASDDDDTELEGRMKNLLEGVLFGTVLEGAIAGVKAYRGAKAAARALEAEPILQSKKAVKRAQTKADTVARRNAKDGPGGGEQEVGGGLGEGGREPIPGVERRAGEQRVGEDRRTSNEPFEGEDRRQIGELFDQDAREFNEGRAARDYKKFSNEEIDPEATLAQISREGYDQLKKVDELIKKAEPGSQEWKDAIEQEAAVFDLLEQLSPHLENLPGETKFSDIIKGKIVAETPGMRLDKDGNLAVDKRGKLRREGADRRKLDAGTAARETFDGNSTIAGAKREIDLIIKNSNKNFPDTDIQMLHEWSDMLDDLLKKYPPETIMAETIDQMDPKTFDIAKEGNVITIKSRVIPEERVGQRRSGEDQRVAPGERRNLDKTRLTFDRINKQIELMTKRRDELIENSTKGTDQVSEKRIQKELDELEKAREDIANFADYIEKNYPPQRRQGDRRQADGSLPEGVEERRSGAGRRDSGERRQDGSIVPPTSPDILPDERARPNRLNLGNTGETQRRGTDRRVEDVGPPVENADDLMATRTELMDEREALKKKATGKGTGVTPEEIKRTKELTEGIDAIDKRLKAGKPMGVEFIDVDDVHPIVKDIEEGKLDRVEKKFFRELTPEQAEVVATGINSGQVISKSAVVIKLGGKHIAVDIQHFSNVAQLEKVIQAFRREFKAGVDDVKGGKISDVELDEFAQKLGTTAEELQAKNPNMIYDVVTVRALQMISDAMGKSLIQLSKAAQGGTLIDKGNVAQAIGAYKGMRASLLGNAARAGQVLRITQWRTGSESAIESLKALDQMLGMYKEDNIDKLIKTIAAVQDPSQILKHLQANVAERIDDTLFKVFVNGLISSPKTQAVNLITGLAQTTLRIPETFIAQKMRSTGVTPKVSAMFHKLAIAHKVVHKKGRQLIGQKSKAETIQKQIDQANSIRDLEMTPEDQALAGDTSSLIHGYLGGMWGGVTAMGDSAFAKSFMTGQAQTDQLVREHFKNFQPLSWEMMKESNIFVYTLDNIVSLPSRFAMSADDSMKALNYRMTVQQEAYRAAAKGKLKYGSTDFQDFVHGFISDPPPEIKIKAIDDARLATFTKELGPVASKLQRAAGIRGVRYFIPFFRTTTNLIGAGLGRSPLAVLSKDVRAKIARGGKEADLELAKISLGTTMIMTAGALSSMGIIQGDGPLNRKLKRQMEKNGTLQPRSIILGGKRYGLNRFDPFSQQLALGANLYDVLSGKWANPLDEQESTDLMWDMAAYMGTTIAPQMYTSELRVMLKAMGGEEGILRSVALNKITGFIPYSSALREIRREVDPLKRNTLPEDPDSSYAFAEEIIAKAKNTIPWLSEDLKPMRNMFGHIIPYKAGLGWDVMSPIEVSDPGKMSLAIKGITERRQVLNMPPKEMSVGGFADPVELTDEEYDTFVLFSAGVGLKEAVIVPVEDKDGRLMPKKFVGPMEERLNYLEKTGFVSVLRHDERDLVITRNRIVKNIVLGYLEAARAAMQIQYPDLRERAKRNQASAEARANAAKVKSNATFEGVRR